jgi:hypothetical protein
MSRLLVPALLVAATFATAICLEVRGAVQSGTGDAAARPTPSAMAAAVPPPAQSDPVEAWATTALERPLMREGRRPAKEAGDPQRKGDDVLRLAGVITGPFGNRAIFIVPGATKPVIAKVGAEITDFVVRTIEPGWVVADAAGTSRTYRPLSAGKLASATAVPKRF